jgi:hypothetical protein
MLILLFFNVDNCQIYTYLIRKYIDIVYETMRFILVLLVFAIVISSLGRAQGKGAMWFFMVIGLIVHRQHIITSYSDYKAHHAGRAPASRVWFIS